MGEKAETSQGSSARSRPAGRRHTASSFHSDCTPAGLKVQPVMGQLLSKIELQETGSPWLRVESVRLCHVGAFGVFARDCGLDIMRAAPLGRADFNIPIESRGWREGRAVALWKEI